MRRSGPARRERGNLAQLLDLLPPGRRNEAATLVVLMLAGGAAEMLSVGAVVPFIAALVGQPASYLAGIEWLLPRSFAGAALLFAFAVIVAGAFRLFLSWRLNRFALETGHWLGTEIFRRVLAQPYSYQLDAHSSGLLAAFHKVQDLVWGVWLPLLQGASSTIMGLLILLLFAWITPVPAAAAAVLFAALYILVTLAVRRRFNRDSEIVGAAYDERVRIVQDSLGGIRDILIDGSQSVYSESFRRSDERFTRARIRSAFLGSAPRYVIEPLGLIVILVLAIVLSRRPGGLVSALPLLGAVALGAQRLLPLMQQIYQSWSSFAANRSAIGDLADLLALPESPESINKPPLPFTRSLRFEGVTFCYPNRSDPAIEDASFTIPRGARVALTGRTGSGKSTLADLAMGLLEPDSGRILVDDVPLTASNRAAWRGNVAHVPQAIFLTDATIAENIAFGIARDRIDPAGLDHAVRTAQLAEFIFSLPQGLETPVGERGVRLSGGQRQRLALARAIYRDKPFLVLDEATSALDSATEAAVIAALDELQREGVTILVIAHRETSIAGCDQEIRLDDGRMVAP